MSDQSKTTETTVIPLQSEARPRPAPRPLAYPSRFGLAVAVSQLTTEYGRIGAINVLIEAAEMLEREEDFLNDTVRRRRLEPDWYANVR